MDLSHLHQWGRAPLSQPPSLQCQTGAVLLYPLLQEGGPLSLRRDLLRLLSEEVVLLCLEMFLLLPPQSTPNPLLFPHLRALLLEERLHCLLVGLVLPLCPPPHL